MRYIYKCNECGEFAQKTLNVDERDRAFPCESCDTGVMRRDKKEQFRSTKIITWSAWCESTAEMLRPTYQDDKAYEESLAEVKSPPKKQHLKEKEKRETFDRLHGMVDAGII